MYEPSPYRQPPHYQAQGGGGAGWIIVLCVLWTTFAPVPGPVDDLIVWGFGAYSAVRGLK
jgi:hypothetical protein